MSSNQVVLVTGAGSGIGAAVARSLAADGQVVICADRDAEAAHAVCTEVGAAQAIALDVSDEDACEASVAELVAVHGKIDGLVHCAGVWEPALALTASEESFDRVVGINLVGTFLLAAVVGRSMIAAGTGGAMVLLASVNAVRADKGQSVYAASKGGVLMLGQVLAMDWAEHGIRVNTIGPGIIDTPMVASVLHGGDADRLLSRTPLGRAGQPSEIADAARFLLSPAASFITGAFLPVDGGWLAD